MSANAATGYFTMELIAICMEHKDVRVVTPDIIVMTSSVQKTNAIAQTETAQLALIVMPTTPQSVKHVIWDSTHL